MIDESLSIKGLFLKLYNLQTIIIKITLIDSLTMKSNKHYFIFDIV